MNDTQTEQVEAPKPMQALDDFIGADADYNRLLASLMAPDAPREVA